LRDSLAAVIKKIFSHNKRQNMIRPLRKYHFFIWSVLAVVLPVVFCLAIVLRPESRPGYDKAKQEDFYFTITKLSSNSGRLTVELKNSLKVPSCVVYLSSSSQNQLLGKIDQVGSYHFDIPLKEQPVSIQLYDPIHKREITWQELSYNNK
jgi:hypothetical protein